MSDLNSDMSDGSQPKIRPRAGSLVLAAATFAVVLDLAGVVILLPSIQAELQADITELTWIVAAFVIAAATTIPLGMRLAAGFGPRRVLLTGLGVFCLASLAAALAPTVSLLIAARAAQGFGAALIEPAVHGLLRAPGYTQQAKQDEQAQGLAALLAAALGPILPAALATILSWRAQFWLDVLLALAIAVAALRTVAAVSQEARQSSLQMRDLLVTVLGISATVGQFFAVIESPQSGGKLVPLIAVVLVAVMLLVVLVIVELRRHDPLLPLRLLSRRRYTVGNIVRAFTEFTSVGVFFPLSGYLQDEIGHSPLIAGLLLMPIILGALLTAPGAEKYGGRVNAPWFLLPGLLCTAAGIFWLAHITSDTPWWFFLAPLAIAGAGIGAVESPTERVVRNNTPKNANRAGWLLSRIFYLWGIGAGVAIVSAVWQLNGVHFAQGVNSALLVCVVAATMAAAVAATLVGQEKHVSER